MVLHQASHLALWKSFFSLDNLLGSIWFISIRKIAGFYGCFFVFIQFPLISRPIRCLHFVMDKLPEFV